MTSSYGLDSLRNIAKLELLTGCHSIEVANARWEELDLEAKIWTIALKTSLSSLIQTKRNLHYLSVM
ncbi:MAG: hypothetical protein GQ546_07055 [Gammaproteobacteria bacterium]|nr:hypothetical protein [Gammaproteobacteria bacterium]